MVQKIIKSPFILQEDVISLEKCEEVVLSLKHSLPDNDIKLNPIKTIKYNQLEETRLMPFVDDLLDIAEPYYGFETRDIAPFSYEWMTEGYKAHVPQTDNSMLFDGKWVKSKDIDFTIIIFLSTSKENDLRDSLLESFGGDMEFINHNLTIKPKAGTMLMFPSGSNFLHTFSNIMFGNLNYVRVLITAKTPYVYDPKQFPGDIRTWFK